MCTCNARYYNSGYHYCLLYYEDKYFEININLLLHKITVIVDGQSKDIPLEDGTAIKDYYKVISTFLNDNGIHSVINTKPQEMDIKTPFEDDEDHHHYQPDKAVEAFKLMHLAHQAESAFINPLRARKIKSGFFWRTFDISCILVYNDHVPFPDHTKIIERAAFDEPMIEFGFWFGDDQFEEPMFFVLPYPFADREFSCNEKFPAGSYYDSQMAEFLIALKNLSDNPLKDIKPLFEASFEEFKEYMEWQGCDHYRMPLQMPPNKVIKMFDL